MPSWYPLVRACRYYHGAYKVRELIEEPSLVTQWALTAEAAEALGAEMARELARQDADLKSGDS